MKILEFVPVEKLPDQPSLGPVLIDNSRGTTLAQKIGVLRDYDADYYIFRHEDLKIETPELIEQQCELMRVNNVAVAGVIGSLIMSTSCAWWLHQRGVVTVGAIMQGDGKGGAYPMLDGPGFRTDAVAVDGSILVMDRAFVKSYEPHDFGHWRFGYDTDACFQALRSGRKVAILDLRCRHESQGGFDPAEFDAFKKRFIEYWKQYVDFPVIAQSTWSNK